MARSEYEDLFQFTNPKIAIAVFDAWAGLRSEYAATTDLGVTPQAVNAWRKGHVEQLSMKVARRVRRMDRRVKAEKARKGAK